MTDEHPKSDKDDNRKNFEQRRPKRAAHCKRERVDSAAYHMQNSLFLFVKHSTMQSIIKMVPDNETERWATMQLQLQLQLQLIDT